MSHNRTNIKLAYELRSPTTRIKTFAVHPVKPWIGLITSNNVFWLSDYQHNLTVKCFNCCTLDDMRPTEIR
jgi:hypothetical protein